VARLRAATRSPLRIDADHAAAEGWHLISSVSAPSPRRSREISDRGRPSATTMAVPGLPNIRCQIFPSRISKGAIALVHPSTQLQGIRRRQRFPPSPRLPSMRGTVSNPPRPPRSPHGSAKRGFTRRGESALGREEPSPGWRGSSLRAVGDHPGKKVCRRCTRVFQMRGTYSIG
jgi:hypothetical protein